MKNLFFTALIATVALGGAYADTINLYPPYSMTPSYTCMDENVNACSQIIGDYYEFEGYTPIDFYSYYTLFYN